jgi:hypothetical protein
MTLMRWIAALYFVVLLIVAGLNYVPGLTDDQGRVFGIFALDIYDDLLHLISAIWAGIAAFVSDRASRNFLRYFGLLYLADGLLGLATGSGYLDLGIINYGFQDLPIAFRLAANAPHIALGGFAAFAGFFLGRR